MRMRPWIGATVACLGMLLVVQHLMGDEPQADADRAARVPSAESLAWDDRLHMQYQINQLEEQLRRQKEMIACAAAPEPTLEDIPAGTSAGEAGSIGEIPYAHIENPVVRDSAIAGDLDRVISSESVDSAWSHDTNRAVAAAVEGLSSGLQLVATDCRTTICRVELTHADLDTQLDDLDDLTTTPPLNTSGFVRVGADGPEVSVIYFTRDGHDLPPPPADAYGR